eukprot:gene11692-biopygen350
MLDWSVTLRGAMCEMRAKRMQEVRNVCETQHAITPHAFALRAGGQSPHAGCEFPAWEWGPVGRLVLFVRTPLRALAKRREMQCNGPALRFPTSVLRLHLRRFAHPRHLAAWGPGPGGLGRPRWPAKNHEMHLIRHGQTKKVASRIW